MIPVRDMYELKDADTQEDLSVLLEQRAMLAARFYSAVSLGSSTFSRIATMAAGTMPEPPKIS